MQNPSPHVKLNTNVKYSDRSLMLWCCFADSDLGVLTIDGIMNYLK